MTGVGSDTSVCNICGLTSLAATEDLGLLTATGNAALAVGDPRGDPVWLGLRAAGDPRGDVAWLGLRAAGEPGCDAGLCDLWLTGRTTTVGAGGLVKFGSDAAVNVAVTVATAPAMSVCACSRRASRYAVASFIDARARLRA